MTRHDTVLALLAERHDTDLERRQSEDRDLATEEQDLIEDLWDAEWAAGMDAADAAWADRGFAA